MIEELKAAYASGKGLQALVAKYNLDMASVLQKAQIEKWPRGNQPAIAEHRELVVPPVDLAQLDQSSRGKHYAERMGALALNALPTLEELPPIDLLASIDQVEKFDKLARRNLGLEKEQTDAPTLNINILSQNLEKYVSQAPPIEIEAQAE